MAIDINAVKRRMLVKYPFFGGIVANVGYKETNKLRTAGTDGFTIYYNPKFLENLSPDDQTFIFAHEVCHIAFNHIMRSEGKNKRLWNTATDGVINQLLKRDGLNIVGKGVDIADAINYDAEKLYDKLLKEKEQKDKERQEQKEREQKEKEEQEQKEQRQEQQIGQDNQGNQKGGQGENPNQSGNGNSSQDQNDPSQNPQNESGENGNSDSSEEQQQGENQQSNSGGQRGQGNQGNQGRGRNSNGNDGEEPYDPCEGYDPNSDEQGEDEPDENEQSDENSNGNSNDGEPQEGDPSNGEPQDGDPNNSEPQEDEQKDDDLSNEDPDAEPMEDDEDEVGHDSHKMWDEAVKKHKAEQNKSKSGESLLDKLLNRNKNKNEIKKQQEELQKLGEKGAFDKNKEDRKKQLEELKEAISKQVGSQAGDSTDDELIEITDIGSARPIVDWRYILREAIKFDVDWSYKNATIEDGVVSPNLEEMPMPETEIVLDTSGSINEVLLKNFLRECKNILQHTRLKVGCFDTQFYGFHEIRTEEDLENMRFEGGGGTDFSVAVNAFSMRVENKIVFTDGEASMPSKPLDAIWMVFGSEIINPPGGRVIHITGEQLDKLLENYMEVPKQKIK